MEYKKELDSSEKPTVHDMKNEKDAELRLQNNLNLDDENRNDINAFTEEFRQSASYYQTATNVHQEIEKISAGIRENKEISREQFNDPNYKANYGTDEQVARDKQITTLLTKYVNNYSDKIEKNGEYKEHIFTVCESIIIMYAIIIPIVILFDCSNRRGRITTGTDVVALISVCVSFLGLIIGLMQIITKYEIFISS